jgi:pimeloyl-ACP methyl ester carboxylesterase
VLVTGCGGGGRTSPEWRRVHFRASDGILLEGRLFGNGETVVVLSHMGREGDSQRDWFGVARLLADKGYRVLTYDRRGVCPGAGAGCSHGIDDYTLHWKDVVGADRHLRRHGAGRVVVVGASIGAMASLYAAARGAIEPDGLLEFAGINHASGYDFTRAELHRIGGRKLFLSARDDIYGGGGAAREWYRWAAPPKRLELVPGSDHGTDLLRPGNPQRKQVERLIASFVEQTVSTG